jgi:membrane protein
LGAALAFYTLLSLAPLVLLVVAICGFFLSRSTAEQELLGQARQLVGYSGADTIRSLVDNASQTRSGLVASSIAIITLIFGASGVFVELRDSLNTIWDAPVVAGGVKGFVVRRLATFGMVLALGFLLLVSLLISAAIGVVERYFMRFLPAGTAVVGEVANVVISLVAITILFALIFKFVPDVPIDWRDVTIGAVVTAIMFTIGRALLAFYMATAGVGSTYGAAGSLVALIVWVYYSAQIFLFGAVFTRIYADTYGSRKRAEKHPVAPTDTVMRSAKAAPG